MSGIKRRTIFMSWLPVVSGEKAGAKVARFTDLASVVTSVGQCVEPFEINPYGMAYDDGSLPAKGTALDSAGYSMPDAYDPKDMMRRIDKISNNTPTGQEQLFRDGETILHRYDRWVRIGP